MWMGRRLGENLLDDAAGEFARALILFQDDEHGHPRFDIRAGLSVHEVFQLKKQVTFYVTCCGFNYDPGVIVGVSVGLGVSEGVGVSVGVSTTGMEVSVGKAVGGIAVGERVGVGVGVGRLSPNVTRFSA